jgi:hypothetical protein
MADRGETPHVQISPFMIAVDIVADPLAERAGQSGFARSVVVMLRIG